MFLQTSEPTKTVKKNYAQSGGLVYHFKAIQYKHSLWSNYCLGVQQCLHCWTPPESKLILVGPSLGWSISKEFLSRFETVIALEPDPWARWFFRRRFSKVKIQWVKQDYLYLPKLNKLKQQFPEHAILFCNVLGQIPLIYPDLNWAIWKEEFLTQLRDWSWASYHDMYSGHSPPPSPALMERIHRLKEPPDHSTLSEVFARNLNRVGHIYDHQTAELFSGIREASKTVAQKNYLLWEISPAYLHLIEFLKSKQGV